MHYDFLGGGKKNPSKMVDAAKISIIIKIHSMFKSIKWVDCIKHET